MKESNSSEELNALLSGEDYMFRFDIGINSCTVKISDIDHLLKLFAKHYLISSVKAELDQLLCGMGVLDVIDLIRSDPNKMKQLFIYNEPDPLTTDKMIVLLPPNYSVSGGNRREKEEEVMMFWVHLLQLIECKIVSYSYI